MVFPSRFLIIVCVLAAAISLCAQNPARPGNQSDTLARQSRRFPIATGPDAGGTVTIEADTLTATITPTRKQYVAEGNAQLDWSGIRLSADRMTYDTQSGDATATGHVAFDSEAEQTHIEGGRATYNFLKATGEFDDFHGVSGIRLNGRRTTALAENPLIFSGSKLLRLGVKRYRLEHGTITSCALPSPKWTFSAGRADIELGANATLHHAVFRLFDVPIFYAPFLTHSTTRQGRHAGVLVPVVSKSNIKGYILGDNFYWPAARNVNVTAGGEYLSARGWADHLAIASLPTIHSSFGLQLDGVVDRGLATPTGARLRQGGQELHVNGEHDSDSGFRTVLDADYLSSYLYRLVFNNTFAEAINSEAISTAFTEKQFAGQDIAVVAHRYQDFLGTSPRANLSLAALPSFDWQAYAQALTRRLPLYFSWDNNAGLLDRSQPGFSTGAMERVDLAPKLTLPVATPAGVVTGDVEVRSTYYSATQALPVGAVFSAAPALLAQDLWRNSTSANLEWRPPVLERVYNNHIEHAFEPVVAYNFTGGVTGANRVIRFDDRDILANTRELEYGFTNRILAAGKMPGQSRELASWTLLQKYYFNPDFSGALITGNRNVFLATEMLSPFDVEALPLRFSPLSSVVRVSPFARFDGEWRLDYDSHDHQVTASAFTGSFHFAKSFFSGSDYRLRPPPGLTRIGAAPSFDQFRLATGYGDATQPGNSVSGSVAYDATTGLMQYTTVQVNHNWDCCGFSLEYRRFSLASVRRENQFLFSFTLANVGTFGNLRGNKP